MPNCQPSDRRLIVSPFANHRRDTWWFRIHWMGMSCALFTATLGCHPLGMRSRDMREATSMLEGDQPPSPQMDPSSKLRIARSDAKGANPAKKLQRLAGSRVSDQIEKSTLPELVETDTPEADLDQALADLPPALQAMLSKQMAAVQQHRQGSTVSDVGGWEDVKLAKPPQRTSGAIAPSEPPILQPSQAVAASPPSMVSVSLSDSDEPAANMPPIQTASSMEPASVDRKNTAVSNEAAVAGGPASENWNRQVAHAIEALEAQIKNTPAADESMRLNQQGILRMLQLSIGKMDAAMTPIDGLEENEQEFFRHQLQAFHEAINPDGVPVRSRRWSLVSNIQRKASDYLASVSNLEVRSLEFCTAVDGYGVITKFPNRTFKPDQDVLLYCELENVAADQKEGFETQLQGSYQIFDRNGERVADQILPVEKEICSNRRRDYFIVYHIYLPNNLPSGAYSLKLTIEDMKARKFGQSTVDFQIGK